MIFVLFGATGEVGDITQRFFKSRGISPISKKNYITDPTLVQSDRVNGSLVSREEVEKCAFHYEISGRLIGFEFQDISRAGRGYENIFMTLSAFDADLLTDLRNAYDARVRIIYVQIDPPLLQKITNSREKLNDKQKADRIKNGKLLRNFYLKNSDLFHNTVYYEETDFTPKEDLLISQYEKIVNRALEQQEQLNADKELHLPYLGQGKYVFASYAHTDGAHVQSLLHGLVGKNCKIWYDRGLAVNAKDKPVDLLWEDELRDRVTNCSQFLLFRSKNAVKQPWVWQEFNWALEAGVHVTVVQLDDTPFGRTKFDVYSQYQSPAYREGVDFVETINRHLIDDVRLIPQK